MTTAQARHDAAAAAGHYARVDAAVALQREGILSLDSPDGLAEALEALGIAPPTRLINSLRARYPNLYAHVEGTPDTGDERDLLRKLNAHATCCYAEELLEAYSLIADYERDPVGTFELMHDTEGLTVPVSTAAADALEVATDTLDVLIGESFQPSHQPG